MALLILLFRAQGATVTRGELINACWDGRIVSEDAIARAIAKVRALARLSAPPAFRLEAVPKIGYRLRIEATVAPRELAARSWPLSPLAAALACLVLIVALAGGASAFLQDRPSRADVWEHTMTPAVRSVDVVDALLNLDEDRLETYLQRGWDPNWRLDSESNSSLHTLMLACERNPTHDKQAVLRTARMLVAAGADPRAPNGWGDTPLTIASSPRYCGPDHPVASYLTTMR